MLEEPYWHLSLDDFLEGFTDGHRLGRNPPSFERVVNGYMQSLRQMALCGNNIVAETVITPHRLATYLQLFGDLHVLLIGLHVPLQEAHRRERHRADRLAPYDVTQRDFDEIHAHGLYDLELNTLHFTPEEAAARVLALVSAPPSPTAFHQLVQRHRR
ncbi:MAG: hypothetical protein NVSMB52_19050 [Chloroflexota bacterium]